jgi:hypothetical protein
LDSGKFLKKWNLVEFLCLQFRKIPPVRRIALLGNDLKGSGGEGSSPVNGRREGGKMA